MDLSVTLLNSKRKDLLGTFIKSNKEEEALGRAGQTLPRGPIRTSIYDKYSGAEKLPHIWIILVITMQHLV
jgi:hypothetical protein